MLAKKNYNQLKYVVDIFWLVGLFCHTDGHSSNEETIKRITKFQLFPSTTVRIVKHYWFWCAFSSKRKKSLFCIRTNKRINWNETIIEWHLNVFINFSTSIHIDNFILWTNNHLLSFLFIFFHFVLGFLSSIIFGFLISDDKEFSLKKWFFFSERGKSNNYDCCQTLECLTKHFI